MNELDLADNNVERLPLRSFTEKAYLNYSMYVILDRALPHVGDGLKPVQRRIVYAMSELGLSAAAKYKKSARTVGDVLGKYHPHGDTACYEAMVLMAQPFSYRYPLIDGQGNWGSPDDPKSFAAMRYTEARMAPYAETLLAELGQGTVDWVSNFDGTLDEPVVLPARLPNVLLNGVTGIAVGMATDIPPHNAREVAAACMRLLDDPQADVGALCEHIQGPDFPTAGEIITSRDELLQMYQSGVGAVRQRARYELEDGNVIVTALPYQVSPAKVLEQIAAQMATKKLLMVEDLRDESDHENPVRLVIITRSNRVDTDALMDHLFATTDLERSYRINFNVIGLDGRPRVKNLKELLGEWLEFRLDTVRRRLQYRLDQVLARLHLLDGLLIAYLNLDEVIRIIRYEEDVKTALMARFALTALQAEAILELKLRHLAKLEEKKIRDEQAALIEEASALERTLNSKKRLRTLVHTELAADAKRYGDARRSPLITKAPAKAFSSETLIPSEPLTVVLSEKGWVRAAKGHDIDPLSLGYKTGDGYLSAVRGRSHQGVVFVDTTGRSYSLPAHALPSARGQGEPLTGRLNPPPEAVFVGMLIGNPEDRYVLGSDAGYGFVARLEDLYAKNKAGKAVLTLPKGARVLVPTPVSDISTDLLAVISNIGKLLVIPLRDLPELAKGKGIKLMGIPAAKASAHQEYVTAMAVIPAGADLVIHAGNRHVRLGPGELKVYLGARVGRGRSLPRGFQKVTQLAVEAH